MTSPSDKSSPFPKPPENCDVCGDQLPLHLARIGGTRHPQCREGGHPQLGWFIGTLPVWHSTARGPAQSAIIKQL